MSSQKKDENAPVQETLGQADQLAARTAKSGIGLDQATVNMLAVVAVFVVEVLFDGLFPHDLIAQQPVKRRSPASGQKHVGLEESPEEKTPELGRRSIGQKRRVDRIAWAGNDEALELAPAKAADIKPELVHIRHQPEKWLDQTIPITGLPGRVEVVETLLDRGTIVVLPRLFRVKSRPDVLELTKHLRHLPLTRAEMPEGQVGNSRASGLPRPRNLELRTTGVGRSDVSLQAVAPGLDEKPLDEGGLRSAFVQSVPCHPCPQTFEERPGFRTGLERGKFPAPLGAQKVIVEQGLGGHRWDKSRKWGCWQAERNGREAGIPHLGLAAKRRSRRAIVNTRTPGF